MVRKINQAWGFAKYPVFVGVLALHFYQADERLKKLYIIKRIKYFQILIFISCFE